MSLFVMWLLFDYIVSRNYPYRGGGEMGWAAGELGYSVVGLMGL